MKYQKIKNELYDVAIFGGGTSGCACAYNCSKMGLKTLLVEKNNFLGGLMTGGLVIPVMKSSASDINCDYYKNLVEVLKKYDAQITYKIENNEKTKNDGWFNPEVLKIALDEILNFDNLDILFESTPKKIYKEVSESDSYIKNVILNCDLLSLPIYSKYYVDATGNATLSKLSGCEFLKDNEQKQKSSLRFILDNVDIKKFSKFILDYDDNRNVTNTYRNETDTNNILHFTTASVKTDKNTFKLDNLFIKGVNDGVLIDSDRDYFQIFSVAGSINQVAFNCPRIENYKYNPYLASRELIYARRAIMRLYKFVKLYFPGFENAQIVNIASISGHREQRRVKTKYIFTKDDLTSSKTFDNPVLEANYAIDIHSDKNDELAQKKYTYQLPLESLMSADIDNLFVVGKILGADFVSHSALRVQKSCMSMGEAVAKYIAKKFKNNISK